MISFTISDRYDNLYPFAKELWDDPKIVYHGSWSTYSQRIDAEGFIHPELPFDYRYVRMVVEAGDALGIGSWASDSPEPNPILSTVANFWGARCYATDNGGELVRMVLKDTHTIEAICTIEESRVALKTRWENGLKGSPNHGPTLKAVRLLSDHQALQQMAQRMNHARAGIEKATNGGFPVVYALRVDSQWFPDLWELYIHHWKKGHRGAVELRCRRDLITVDRVVAKAMYPNGTDSDFQPDGFETWKQLKLLPWARESSEVPLNQS